MGRFNPEHEITIGCEFMSKNIRIKDRDVRIQIWDTAGQETYRSITRTYYKSSTCAFIIYDITDRKSFSNITSWLNECKEMCYKDILICLVGNKTDLEEKRAVQRVEGERFAEDNGLLFFETSAKILNIESLTMYYVKINKEKEDEARKDATLFIQGARLFKSTDDISITFEEFIVAICRIVKVHGLKVVDDFINKFKEIRKKVEPKVVEEDAEGNEENKAD